MLCSVCISWGQPRTEEEEEVVVLTLQMLKFPHIKATAKKPK